MKDDHMTDEEIANAEAAVTLAVVPEEERLPEELRARVEADARAFLGQRAKEHARRRAETAAPARSLDSTTAAGSQVLVPDDDEPVRAKAPLLPYAGWLVAVAASVALFVSHNRSAPSAAGSTNGTTQEITLLGAGGASGTVSFDRTRGTGLVRLAATPPGGDAKDRLQVWLTFEGDAAPRPVLLVASGAKEASFGTESPLCLRAAGLEPRSGAGVCAAIRSVQITRAPRTGVLVFEPSAVVMKADASP